MTRKDVAERLGLREDSPHLEEALTHPSYANERGDKKHYQRLEFLGDAVLQLFASEALWRAFPAASEGELTRRRAQLVNSEALATFARELGVAPALLVGKGAEANGVRAGSSVLSDTLEALIAATYLDAGFDAARELCERVVSVGLDQLSAFRESDPKTVLQERAQGAGLPTPSYRILESWGPAHERWFKVGVSYADNSFEGTGRSRRAAEREAAERALQHLGAQAEPSAPSEEAG